VSATAEDALYEYNILDVFENSWDSEETEMTKMDYTEFCLFVKDKIWHRDDETDRGAHEAGHHHEGSVGSLSVALLVCAGPHDCPVIR